MHLLTRVLSTVLSFALLIPSLAQPSLASPVALPFDLSPRLGFITESWASSSSAPRIVIIQDLHLHYETQKRIIKILDHLFTQKIVSGPVAVEGVEGVYDTTKLAVYPAGKLKTKLVDYFLKKGELSGDEAFSILKGDGKILYGVDSASYYGLNKDLYKKTLASRQALEAKLKPIQEELSYLKKKHRRDTSVLGQNVKQAGEMVNLLQRLLHQEVTLEEARYIAQRLPAFVEVSEKLLSSSSPQVVGGDPASSDLEETIRSAVDFYIVALMRDKPLAQNTVKLLKRLSDEASKRVSDSPHSPTRSIAYSPSLALVTGGFHTAGLTRAFKQANISYTVITPRLDKAPSAQSRALYEKRLSNISLDQAEMSSDLHLSVTMVAVRASKVFELLPLAWDKLTAKRTLRFPSIRFRSPRRMRTQFGGIPFNSSNSDREETKNLAEVLSRWSGLKEDLRNGIALYLDKKKSEGVFTAEKAAALLEKTMTQVELWAISSSIDRFTRLGIVRAIENQRWEDIVTAFSDQLKFGTAGPRSKAALTTDELVSLRDHGFTAPILKGSNTVNNVTIARLTTGVARHFKRTQVAKGRTTRPRVSITWDSRVHGRGFADLVAAIFIHEGLDVFLFDVSSPMPEMSFSVAELKLDLGILISASHNPEAFNGYKVSDPVGAQLSPTLRKAIEASIYGDPANGIFPVTLEDVAWIVKASANLADPTGVIRLPSKTMGPLTFMAWQENGRKGLTFLGQEDPPATANGIPAVRNIHEAHRRHVLDLLLLPINVIREHLANMYSLYSAMYGNGENTYNRLLMNPEGLGLPSHSVKEFARLDGLFPLFANHKPKALIPDPGNSAGQAHAWAVVMQSLREELGSEEKMKRVLFQIGQKRGLVMGTDPDADRAGVAVPIPAEQLSDDPSIQEKQLVFYVVPPQWREEVDFAALRLLPANDTWALITKYRIDRLSEILTFDQKKNLHFSIIKTHVTTDQIKALKAYAESRGFAHIEIIEPFVGFSLVADAIRDGWRRGVINISGQEESGGFSIGGAPPVIYALLHLFQKDNQLGLDWDEEENSLIKKSSPSSTDSVLLSDKVSYYGYSQQELTEALGYLLDQNILMIDGAGYYSLRHDYRGLNHDDFWARVNGFVDDAPGSRLGKRGHTMEKDGLMALVLLAEVAAYASSLGKTLNQYLWDELYAKVGYFSTTNQSKEFAFTQAGAAEKIRYLQSVLEHARRVGNGWNLSIDHKLVARVEIFVPKDQKYADSENFPVESYKDLLPLLSDPELRNNPALLKSFFPEEGVRFYFTDGSHLTVRPSGTEPKLRFYVQWLATDIQGDMTEAQRYQKADITAYDVAIAAKSVLGAAPIAHLMANEPINLIHFKSGAADGPAPESGLVRIEDIIRAVVWDEIPGAKRLAHGLTGKKLRHYGAARVFVNNLRSNDIVIGIPLEEAAGARGRETIVGKVRSVVSTGDDRPGAVIDFRTVYPEDEHHFAFYRLAFWANEIVIPQPHVNHLLNNRLTPQEAHKKLRGRKIVLSGHGPFTLAALANAYREAFPEFRSGFISVLVDGRQRITDPEADLTPYETFELASFGSGAADGPAPRERSHDKDAILADIAPYLEAGVRRYLDAEHKLGYITSSERVAHEQKTLSRFLMLFGDPGIGNEVRRLMVKAVVERRWEALVHTFGVLLDPVMPHSDQELLSPERISPVILKGLIPPLTLLRTRIWSFVMYLWRLIYPPQHWEKTVHIPFQLKIGIADPGMGGVPVVLRGEGKPTLGNILDALRTHYPLAKNIKLAAFVDGQISTTDRRANLGRAKKIELVWHPSGAADGPASDAGSHDNDAIPADIASHLETGIRNYLDGEDERGYIISSERVAYEQKTLSRFSMLFGDPGIGNEVRRLMVKAVVERRWEALVHTFGVLLDPVMPQSDSESLSAQRIIPVIQQGLALPPTIQGPHWARLVSLSEQLSAATGQAKGTAIRLDGTESQRFTMQDLLDAFWEKFPNLRNQRLAVQVSPTPMFGTRLILHPDVELTQAIDIEIILHLEGVVYVKYKRPTLLARLLNFLTMSSKGLGRWFLGGIVSALVAAAGLLLSQAQGMAQATVPLKPLTEAVQPHAQAVLNVVGTSLDVLLPVGLVVLGLWSMFQIGRSVLRELESQRALAVRAGARENQLKAPGLFSAFQAAMRKPAGYLPSIALLGAIALGVPEAARPEFLANNQVATATLLASFAAAA